MARSVRALWSGLWALSPIRQDALLYALGAVYTLITLLTTMGDYHTWASISFGPYLAAAVASELVWRTAVRRSPGISAARGVTGRVPGTAAGPETPGLVAIARRGILLVVFLLVALVPLGALMVWRAEGLPGAHAQEEVRVIESAGDRAAHGQDPYLSDPTSVGVNPTSDSKAVDNTSFYPYLPGMVPFGLINELPGPPEVGDARLALTGFTLAVVLSVLLVSDAPGSRKVRALQVLLVLPTGALFIATGGDDLPVLSLMLLGMVLADRRWPTLAGIVMGLAASFKLTAWPLVILCGLCLPGDEDGARWRYSAAVVTVLVPVTLAGFLPSPTAFVVNVIKFPLGLASVKSPAASPLLGEQLTSLFPQLRKEITVLLLIAGALAVLGLLLRYPPKTPAAAARITAIALTLGTVLSPATRFGYLIYPADMLVFAYLLDGGVGGLLETRFSRRPQPGRELSRTA